MTSHSKARCLDSVEWQMLLECASPARNDERLAKLTRDVEWPEVLRLAGDHGVHGHLAVRLDELSGAPSPEHVKTLLNRLHRAQLFHSLKLTRELFRLMERLASAGIVIITLKGPVLAAQAYANASMRSFNDLDLLVRQRNIAAATEVMIAEGYHPKIPLEALGSGKIPGQYFFYRKDERLIVEIHTEKTLRYFPRRLPIETIFQKKTGVLVHGREVASLSTEDSLVLICIHGAKHFWEKLMWSADVAGLVARQRIDWSAAFAAAEEVGGSRMLHAGLRVVGKLFGTALPDDVAARVVRDKEASRIAGQVIQWLPRGAGSEPSLLQRARFRMSMRGGAYSAPAYLLRLTVSPTEEDWGDAGIERNWLWDAILRPFRLVRKYRRKP
jgi:hypothetical protein